MPTSARRLANCRRLLLLGNEFRPCSIRAVICQCSFRHHWRNPCVVHQRTVRIGTLSIGFIAVFGVAMLNGIVLVSFINELRESGSALPTRCVKGRCCGCAPC